MASKKFYRLFKVAKELNVGTAMLVDHLEANGHSVDNSPNTKLSADLYDLLLKEFASEKLMKEKADKLSEQRKQEIQRSSTTAPPAVPLVAKKSDEDPMDRDVISADQLRSSLQPNGDATVITAPEKETEAKEPVKPAVEAVETPTAKAPVPEAEKPDPESPKVETEPKEEDSSSGGLKVLGKIDLDAIGKKGKKPAKKSAPPKKEAEAPAAPKAKAQEAAPEKKVEKAPVESPAPVAEKAKAPVQEKPVEEPKPVEPETKPVVEEKVETKAAPEEKVEAPVETKVTAETPAVESTEDAGTDEETKETVIRAGDNMPQLSGLKVMGKIELPGDKPKKKESTETAKTGTTKSNEDEDEGNKKKRRRRRKRKRKAAVKTDVDKKGGGDANRKSGGKGKKEKPTQTEVDKSLRDTLSAMGRGASRNRQRLRKAKRDADAARRERREQEDAQKARILELTEFITANEFADLISVSVTEIIKKSFELGTMISINQRLDAELLSIIAEEYGYEIDFVDITDQEFEFENEADDPENLEGRNPIITVMGHVDHGKTTLLDHLRNANVTASEAGGITQHIGAYEVKLTSGRQVTFLDTPGHEAFTAMRARGAKATDVAIIVVAADDAVMPQTKEAINHARAAEVPMIFALNKIDKAGADPERIKGQLAEMNILVEDWGGSFQSQDISALKGEGVDELLEKVILESDILELKANPNKHAAGVVIEARIDKGRGNVVTLLVQNGTLKIGDELVAGIHYGKVRALIDQNGKRIKEAGPSTPIQVLGLVGIPTAGDRFQVFTESGKARQLSQKRSELYREQQFRQTKHITLEEITRRRAIGNFKELNIIIRGDVDGSVEALSGALLKLSTEEVQVNIVTKGVGAISEADVNLAIASDAVILAFNVRPNAQARNLAEREEIDIRTYSVIYDAINDVKDALEGLLSPELKEEILGTAEVREVFKITRVGSVAGSYVTSGKITKNDPVRIIRDGVVIYDSVLTSLKRFKDDVKEVSYGYECGFMVENYNDIKVGDVLESYRVKEIRRKLA